MLINDDITTKSGSCDWPVGGVAAPAGGPSPLDSPSVWRCFQCCCRCTPEDKPTLSFSASPSFSPSALCSTFSLCCHFWRLHDRRSAGLLSVWQRTHGRMDGEKIGWWCWRGRGAPAEPATQRDRGEPVQLFVYVTAVRGPYRNRSCLKLRFIFLKHIYSPGNQQPKTLLQRSCCCNSRHDLSLLKLELCWMFWRFSGASSWCLGGLVGSKPSTMELQSATSALPSPLSPSPLSPTSDYAGPLSPLSGGPGPSHAASPGRGPSPNLSPIRGPSPGPGFSGQSAFNYNQLEGRFKQLQGKNGDGEGNALLVWVFLNLLFRSLKKTQITAHWAT